MKNFKKKNAFILVMGLGLMISYQNCSSSSFEVRSSPSQESDSQSQDGGQANDAVDGVGEVGGTDGTDSSGSGTSGSDSAGGSGGTNEVPLPSSTDVIFADDFSSGDLNLTKNGFRWGELRWGHLMDGRVRFNFVPETSISELRFSLGSKQYKELWIKYDLTIPANYRHLNGNNKALVSLWSNSTGTRAEDGYSHPDEMFLGTEFWPIDGSNPYGESKIAIRGFAPNSGYDFNARPSGMPTDRFISSSDFGSTVTFVVHVKVSSRKHGDSIGEVPVHASAEGQYRIWKNGQKIMDVQNFDFGKQNWNGFNRGYILGWTNGPFSESTFFFVDNFVIATQNVFGVH